MYCEHYRCKMSEYACIARRRNSLSQTKTDGRKAGFSDPFCKSCKLGKQIAQKNDPKELAKYSEALKQARLNGIEYKKETGLNASDIAELDALAKKRPTEKNAPSKILSDAPKKKRGRPVGSINKPKPRPKQDITDRQIKEMVCDVSVVKFLELEIAQCEERIRFYKLAIAALKRSGASA